MRLNKTLAGLPITLVFANAHASSTNPQYAISAGWASLINSSGSDAFSSSGFIVEGSYIFQNSLNGNGMGMGQTTSTSLDLTWDQFSGHGDHLTQLALEVAGRMAFGGDRRHVNASSFSPYVGLGIGLVDNFAHVTIPGVSGGTSTTANPSRIDLAAKAMVGLNLSSNFFVEGAYRYNGSNHGARLDTVSVTVGVRF